MKSADLRRSFVDYFAARDHRVVVSSPLVPQGDATLLFTNAGMVQFKDLFTGAATPEFRRAVSVQKCLRVSGKHNDLENVGPSPRHHTFFEMLGNFSFGDYFKAEAISWAWELVTAVWGLPAERLFASVFREDDEAFELWRKISGLPPARIQRRGEQDNFWAMGDTGPCGPCSEIFVDRAPGLPPVAWDEGTESGRYLEIWNLVFMQFERDAAGRLAPLPKPSIDTGAGLERVAAVLAGVDSNYDTDLFRPLLEGTAALAGKSYGTTSEDDVSMRVVADHLRAVAFLLADGVIPTNEGRGYVLRRLLRRAARHGLRLGFDEPFLCRLLPLVDEAMAGAYPELAATRSASEAMVRAEEEKFLSTVATGSRMVQEAIEEARRRGDARTLDGRAVFRLYDTHGLPIQLVREIAEEERFGVDEEGFEAELAAQRERSRAAGGREQARRKMLQDYVRAHYPELVSTRFEGYEKLSVEGAQVLAAARWAQGRFGEGVEPRKLNLGDEAVLVFDVTPFYAEAGGQVGDVGKIRWDGGEAEVVDTQKDNAGVAHHFVRVTAGSLHEPFPSMSLSVSARHRLPTQRNHTATHLLHAALRQVLGDGVRQAGSLVHPDHLRFDFTFGRPLSAEERHGVERIVDEWVLRAVELRIVADRPIEEARSAGAMALFGEKYGERVRTVEVPGLSLELCGGCHVRNTGEIGPFVLRAERGVASGVRRIEALTGERALAYLRGRDTELGSVEETLGVESGSAVAALAALKTQLRVDEKELSKLRQSFADEHDYGSKKFLDEDVNGIRIQAFKAGIATEGDLRRLADRARDKLRSGVVVLSLVSESKVRLVVASSKDVMARLPANALARELATLVGGSGGGRPDFATAGGRKPELLDSALSSIPKLAARIVAGAA